MSKSFLSKVKAFGMTNSMVAQDLTDIEKRFQLDLGHLDKPSAISESKYYPQFDASIRSEAKQMAQHYEVFYSLEKSIRKLVTETLTAIENSPEWWKSNRVPPSIKLEVQNRITKELDAGVTARSQDELDYTTFGELGNIIVSNWDAFGGIFNSKKAVEKIMSNLNALRNPIAHCSPLAEDEVVRLELALRDWFRLME